MKLSFLEILLMFLWKQLHSFINLSFKFLHAPPTAFPRTCPASCVVISAPSPAPHCAAFSPPALRQPGRKPFGKNREKYWIFISNESKTVCRILFAAWLLFSVFSGILLSVSIRALFTESKEMRYKCKTARVHNFEKRLIKKNMSVLGSRFTEVFQIVWNLKRTIKNNRGSQELLVLFYFKESNSMKIVYI